MTSSLDELLSVHPCGRDGGKEKRVADCGQFLSLLPLGVKEE